MTMTTDHLFGDHQVNKEGVADTLMLKRIRGGMER